MNAIDRNSKGRKYEQVLAGARKVFLADGYEGASVDAIARAAGVSKATLYSYFPHKRRLFAEVARLEFLRQAEAAQASIDPQAPVETVLLEAARHMIRFYLSDFAQSVYRVCVGEAARFPDLARAFYETGPKVAQDTLMAYLECAAGEGMLDIDDLPLAANQFAELCKAEIFHRRVFRVQERFDAEATERVARGAVSTFMARYGT